MKVKYSFIVATMFAILAVLSFMIYHWTSFYIDESGVRRYTYENGLVVEQFAFIPIGLLCTLLAAGFGAYWLDLKGFVKLKYSCIISMGLGVLSFVIYHLTSGYDEIFVLKPIGFFFAFVTAICGACMLARYLVGLLKKT